MVRNMNKDKKHILIKFIYFVGFNIALFLILLGLNHVFRIKDLDGIQDRFKAYDSKNPDIIFIGSSHQFCTVDPDLLYKEYGIDSFMLASSGQTFPVSYYAAMEAIELKKPKKIVLEIAFTSSDAKTIPGLSYYFFDGFPNSKARKAALEDLFEKEERINYLIPIGTFHERWKELKKSDFGDFTVSKRGGYYNDRVISNGSIPLTDPSVITPMSAENEDYMDKLVEMCKKEGVELLLYVAPYNSPDNSQESIADVLNCQAIYNYVGEYAKRNDIPFMNMFYEMDNIGIDMDRDWMEQQHLNCYGQEKATRYLVDCGFLSR